MNPSRRSFLKQLTVTGSALAFAPLFANADPAYAPVWVVLGPASKYAKGTTVKAALPATAGGHSIFITHAADDTYLALSAVCTHRGCEVDYTDADKEYVCPCHRGKFDAKGAVVAGPPRRPLPAYPTRVNADGTLSVDVSAG